MVSHCPALKGIVQEIQIAEGIPGRGILFPAAPVVAIVRHDSEVRPQDFYPLPPGGSGRIISYTYEIPFLKLLKSSYMWSRKMRLAAVAVVTGMGRLFAQDGNAGINEANTTQIPVSGGLAADGYNFVSTLTGVNAAPGEGNIIAIALCGNNLVVKYGTEAGWENFGPERVVTSAIRSMDRRFSSGSSCVREPAPQWMTRGFE